MQKALKNSVCYIDTEKVGYRIQDIFRDTISECFFKNGNNGDTLNDKTVFLTHSEVGTHSLTDLVIG